VTLYAVLGQIMWLGNRKQSMRDEEEDGHE
jgi:hypothetical protein